MKGKRMKRTIPLLGVFVILLECGNSQPPTADTTSGPQRELCKTAIVSFLQAHMMMSDESGKIVQLNNEQTEKMKSLIRTGITAASGVSDAYLTKVHSELPVQFRSHLVKGWKLYLNGLDQSKLSLQVQGIQLVQKWEAFKEKNIDYLYRAIIE